MTMDSMTLAIQTDSNTLRVKKCKLLAISGTQQGQEFILDKDIFTIGSSRHSDLQIEDTTVSRRHCEIRVSPDGCTIRDLGSTNGTMVRGVRVTEAFLTQGTEFQLGNTRLVFCPMQETMEYAVSRSESFGALQGTSVPMRRVFHLAETYAPTDATVLIEGETGTGKEVLAEAIHKRSRRASKPFVVIDCASLAKELVESELFGHTKGAFTGASIDRAGAFEFANGGTVFLDEIGDLAPELQPKLLRVLEKREVRRVGSNHMTPVDVRILCATNHELQNQVNNGRFREDLYYRLSVVHIEMPPLRRRKEDIPVLVRRFLRDFRGEKAEQDIKDLATAIRGLEQHDWPGNVRELRNLVELACCSGRDSLELSAFFSLGRVKTARQEPEAPVFSADEPFKTVKNRLVSDFEKRYIEAILARHGGNISRAAQQAGIERAYLQRLIKKYRQK
jgi:transcriptional regulator with PAS, ATPase and Fis domain